MADPTETIRRKVRDAARRAAEDAAETRDVAPEARDVLLGEIEDFAAGLFDQFLAVAVKKGEDPVQAGAKTAKIVAARVGREAAQRAAKAPKAPPPPPLGEVSGKTQGVNRKILAILNAVSAHYGEPVQVISGKRDPRKVATAIFSSWNSHLRKGRANDYLNDEAKLRARLDALKEEKDRAGFEAMLISKADMDRISPHMTGDAVDLPQSTDPNVIAALATCLAHKSERNLEGQRCHHFDTARLVWPIPASTRARWPEQDA